MDIEIMIFEQAIERFVSSSPLPPEVKRLVLSEQMTKIGQLAQIAAKEQSEKEAAAKEQSEKEAEGGAGHE